MLGILVYGDNHLILRGPRPTLDEARMLARRAGMSLVVEIGGTAALPEPWRISTREFRENLRWAVVLGPAAERTAAVRQLLDEMMARDEEVTWESE